ncbi:MAG: imidazole glycerol phosphate synthase subunit HisF [Candidatus Hodgkinia cicadicola]
MQNHLISLTFHLLSLNSYFINRLTNQSSSFMFQTGLSNRLIVSLPVKSNSLVRSTQFRNLMSIGDPIAFADMYGLTGADELFLLNVSASAENKAITCDLVKQISQVSLIPLAVGGGIRRLSDVESLLRSGADKVIINSSSALNPEFMLKCVNKFGSHRIVASIDCKPANGSWEVFSHSGLRATGINAISHACEMERYGVGEIMLTSIDKSGTQKGFDVLLLKIVTSLVSIPVIASGGFGVPHHAALALIDGGASAVAIGSQLHQNQYSITQIKHFLGQCGLLVRDDYIRLGLIDL